MKTKLAEKNNRISFLDKEMENFNRSRSDETSTFANKYMPNWTEYSKYANENQILENYIRSESYRASLDMIQSLKQTIEQISYETEKVTTIKTELETEKSQFDETLRKLRLENRQFKDENEKLLEELEKRKSAV